MSQALSDQQVSDALAAFTASPEFLALPEGRDRYNAFVDAYNALTGDTIPTAGTGIFQNIPGQSDLETALTRGIGIAGAAVVVGASAISVLSDVVRGAQALLSLVVSGVKALWTDVLHPIIGWVDTAVTRIRTWLGNTFGPVFSFLRSVRDAVTGVYNRFLRPILDAIDFVHQLDQLLQVFHINVLKGLDNTLQSVEQRIDGVMTWIYGKLNDISNVLTTIITADGFFQRYTLLRSLARDVNYHWRLLANTGRRPLSEAEGYRITRAAMIPTIPKVIDDTAAWLADPTLPDNDDMNAAVATWDEFARSGGDVTA